MRLAAASPFGLQPSDVSVVPAAPPSRDRAFGGWLWGAAAALAGIAARLAAFKLGAQTLFVDFLALWTGGRMANARPSRLYDFAATDRAQAWLLGAAAHDRLFPYPPSSLLVFLALSMAAPIA